MSTLDSRWPSQGHNILWDGPQIISYFSCVCVCVCVCWGGWWWRVVRRHWKPFGWRTLLEKPMRMKQDWHFFPIPPSLTEKKRKKKSAQFEAGSFWIKDVGSPGVSEQCQLPGNSSLLLLSHSLLLSLEEKEQRQASFYINGEEKIPSTPTSLPWMVWCLSEEEMVFGFTVVLNCPRVESKETEIMEID